MDEVEIDFRDKQEDDANVLDEASRDDSSVPQTYDITSYGGDFDVDGLVKRLRNGHIFVPAFQRDYVWSLRDASRLIESLLLGLPVPGIFLAKEPDSQRMLVIDGQQRLKTLLFFYDGVFNLKPDQKTQRIFKLSGVQPQFEGKTYATLDERDRVRLNDTIIHATIIKQESPAGDNTSVYHVFERLNTGGRKLMPQEIRVAIFQGNLVELLGRMNMIDSWRTIFGRESNRMKDQELILRFLAMRADAGVYEKPMSEFLNRFAKKHKNLSEAEQANFYDSFSLTISVIAAAIGQPAFRPERALNAAVFDSVMVALAERLERSQRIDLPAVAKAYEALLADADFKRATSESTSDTTNVALRLARARHFLGGLPEQEDA